jgi:hypothetical protein
MGAPHLAARGGKVYWELRIVSAKGWAGVGFAGTSFRSGPQAPQDAVLGADEASWALYVDDGRRNHGCADPPR